MTALRSAIYAGTVTHKRLVPRQHAFTYRVFALALDVDEIDLLDRDTRLFSRGRFNLLSFHDRDYAAGDGARVADYARRLVSTSGLAQFTARITLVSYPRVLGYAFNPLSVYFCRDADGTLGAVVYEVTNTFRERRSYVIPVGDTGPAGAVLVQRCAKQMYVSPFTAPEATYGFHIVPPAERIVVGVDLREGEQPVLKTHFSGERLELDDRTIAGLMLSHPLLTLKVIGGIHLEAARLWLKGVPLAARHASPRYTVSVVNAPSREAPHA